MTSQRTLAIVGAVAPAIEASKRERGYYMTCVEIRGLIAAQHGDKVGNTVYRSGLSALVQQHIPLFSSKGAREFASIARKLPRAPLIDLSKPCASPFKTTGEWLDWRLKSLPVAGEVRLAVNLRLLRSDENEFRVYHANKVMLIRGDDYPLAVARLHIALLFGSQVSNLVRGQVQQPGLSVAESRRAEVKALYLSGHTYTEIARLKGIAVSTALQDVLRSGAREGQKD